jgi:hypothetical protein
MFPAFLRSFAASEIFIALPPYGLRFVRKVPAIFLAVKYRVDICNESIQMDDYG